MKVLHVTSDWKWTGQAAPMLELLLAQRARGSEVELACPAPPEAGGSSLLDHARAAGVEPVFETTRGRRAFTWRDRAEVRGLASLVSDRRFDVVHAWNTRDHVLAFRATIPARGAGLTRIVRSWAHAERIADRPWNRWLFGRAADGMLCVSPAAAAGNAYLRRGRAVVGALGSVDLERFSPGEPDRRVRGSLGLAANQPVVGIVARAQRHRRFDLLLDAFGRLAQRDSRVRLLVVGRGTHQDEVVAAPARGLGLAERVILAGHRTGDYADVLRCMDVFTLLVPGSDGGCRALREAAACGVPAVTTRRGALPEIVRDAETGFVVDESPAALAAAWGRLLADDLLRSTMGEAARRRAERAFHGDRYAAEVERLYRAAYR